MANCGGSCGGNCASCGGCARELTLTEMEVDFLLKFAQIPFLPVARRMDDDVPVYLEDAAYSQEEYSLILQVLEQKNLVSLDYDQPLAGSYGDGYAAYPVKGSAALTARGQTVVEMLEISGLQ